MALRGKTALITGAGGGIGRALAVALAARGCHLALADIAPSGLAETAESLASSGVRISRHLLDVAEPEQIVALPDAIEHAHDGLDVLINNAGVAIGGTFEEIEPRDFAWLMDINFWGVVRMTRAFLPMLRQSADARIVNLSSLFGIVAPPGQTAYSASKFAVRGFSQALAHELVHTRIGVTIVHPGGIATKIASSARPPKAWSEAQAKKFNANFEKHLKMPPDETASIIVRAVERRKGRVLVGRDAQIAAAMERVFPVSYWRRLTPPRKPRPV